MLSQRKKAAPLSQAAAPKSVVYHKQMYSQREQKSIAKLQLGTLLLALQSPLSQKQREKGWALFELLLRRYFDLKFSGVRL